MHPVLHISALVSYELEPKRTYGALYHLVATFSVNILSLPFCPMYLTKPKSHILREQSLFRRILEGFKSL